ncbi:MAG: hypothetical protein LBD27_01025 [Tannerella sp.]|nr:hypothetical protein [Tannerella sp.]
MNIRYNTCGLHSGGRQKGILRPAFAAGEGCIPDGMRVATGAQLTG